MTSRTEEAASRIADRVGKGSKTAAAGAVAKGFRRVAKFAEETADALEAPARRRSRIKTAAKVAGAAAVVAGAVLLARRATKK